MCRKSLDLLSRRCEIDREEEHGERTTVETIPSLKHSRSVATICDIRAQELDDYNAAQAITFPFRLTYSTQIRRIFAKVISERTLDIIRIVERYRQIPQVNTCQHFGDDNSQGGQQAGTA